MKKPLQIFFGIQVALLRKDQHLTQEALADASKIARSYLSGIESGQRNPTLTTISRIAEALGVEMKEIFVYKIRPTY